MLLERVEPKGVVVAEVAVDEVVRVIRAVVVVDGIVIWPWTLVLMCCTEITMLNANLAPFSSTTSSTKGLTTGYGIKLRS